VNVRIGLVHSPQPLEVELADDADLKALKASISGALSDEKPLWLVDKKGNEVAVVADKVTFITIGTGSDKGRIGFGS
jgi:hypothetical protein